MNIGQMVMIDGYDVVATAMTDEGQIQVLNNNSDTYLVVRRVAYGDNNNLSGEGKVLHVFQYLRGESFVYAYGQALLALASEAVEHTADESMDDEITAEQRETDMVEKFTNLLDDFAKVRRS